MGVEGGGVEGGQQWDGIDDQGGGVEQEAVFKDKGMYKGRTHYKYVRAQHNLRQYHLVSTKLTLVGSCSVTGDIFHQT